MKTLLALLVTSSLSFSSLAQSQPAGVPLPGSFHAITACASISASPVGNGTGTGLTGLAGGITLSSLNANSQWKIEGCNGTLGFIVVTLVPGQINTYSYTWYNTQLSPNPPAPVVGP